MSSWRRTQPMTNRTRSARTPSPLEQINPILSPRNLHPEANGLTIMSDTSHCERVQQTRHIWFDMSHWSIAIVHCPSTTIHRWARHFILISPTIWRNILIAPTRHRCLDPISVISRPLDLIISLRVSSPISNPNTITFTPNQSIWKQPFRWWVRRRSWATTTMMTKPPWRPRSPLRRRVDVTFEFLCLSTSCVAFCSFYFVSLWCVVLSKRISCVLDSYEYYSCHWRTLQRLTHIILPYARISHVDARIYSIQREILPGLLIVTENRPTHLHEEG